MRPRKFEVIECPRCGREYLPAELFVPKYFFGKPYDIVRDVYGKILDYEGTSIDLNESYTCDKCGTDFDIRAKISFVSGTGKLDNMDEPYTSRITAKNNLFLTEY